MQCLLGGNDGGEDGKREQLARDEGGEAGKCGHRWSGCGVRGTGRALFSIWVEMGLCARWEVTHLFSLLRLFSGWYTKVPSNTLI